MDLKRLKLLFEIDAILQTCLLVRLNFFSLLFSIFLYTLPVISNEFKIINKFTEVNLFPYVFFFIRSFIRWPVSRTSYREMASHILSWLERHCYILAYIHTHAKMHMYEQEKQIDNNPFLYLWEPFVCN